MKGKKIIIGVTGSIAAYKIALLTRLLIKQGADVRILMTPSSKDFITPLTLSTLSKNPVYSDVSSESEWNNHVELGLWADAFVVAPATANTIAKMATGQCDNIVLATYLSAKCPVFIAPAMDLDMWKHPATVNNLKTLSSYGNHLIPVGTGELASGLVGAGRMAEPEDIASFLDHQLSKGQKLKGKRILVTSGPTHEPIDPVRFIGNRSSGKMGAAIVEALHAQGAEVIMVTGPASFLPDADSAKIIKVKSAAEMYEASSDNFGDVDIAIMAAAVADYTPKEVSPVKIKKKSASLSLQLTKTKDIAKELGKIKKSHQTMVGFALETNNEMENAQGKLAKKNFDFIVLNSLQDKGAGFQHNTNKITIVDKHENVVKFKLKSKQLVAKDIVNYLITMVNGKNN